MAKSAYIRCVGGRLAVCFNGYPPGVGPPEETMGAVARHFDVEWPDAGEADAQRKRAEIAETNYEAASHDRDKLKADLVESGALAQTFMAKAAAAWRELDAAKADHAAVEKVVDAATSLPAQCVAAGTDPLAAAARWLRGLASISPHGRKAPNVRMAHSLAKALDALARHRAGEPEPEEPPTCAECGQELPEQED